MSAGRPFLQSGIGWRIFAGKPANPAKDEGVVWSGGGAAPNIHLAPGRYYVEATYGFARSGQEIEVAPDRMADSIVVLNAGTILAQAVAAPGGAPLTEVFYILRRADPAGTPGPEIGRSSLSRATFHVPAGQYRLALQHGLAKAEIPVTVAAGEEKQAEAVMNSGQIRLTAVARPDGPPLDEAVFFVYAEDNSGNLRELARSELREAEFNLPAGRYRIAATYGLARVERDIALAAGAELEEKLVLDAGGVKLTSLLSGGSAPLDRQLVYKVYALSAEQGNSTQSIATSAKPASTIFLKSGRYRVESQYGWHNCRQSRDVTVNAGEITDVVFEHRASEVRLRLAEAAGSPALGRVKWTLKYANGGTVLISQDNAPVLTLQAGSYQVVAQHGAKTYSRAFEALPNEVHIIELITE
jgi:hypothetical protein